MKAAARGGNVNTNIAKLRNARRGASWNTAPTKGAGRPEETKLSTDGGTEALLSDERKRDQRLMVYAQTSCPSVTFGFGGLTRFTALAGRRADRRPRVLAAG
jgi:hypothetical protein